MIQTLGDFHVGATVRFMWNTGNTSGASITRDTNGTIRIYKNNSTTERSSSNGITDTEDFDSLTGLHQCVIDTSDNTDSGFYAAGNDYFVVIQGTIIDGQTINACLAKFSIENQNMKTNAINADMLASDVTTELQSGLATASAVSTLAGYVDTEVASIKTKTDQLTFSATNALDVNVTHVNEEAIIGDGAGTPWGPA